MMRNEQDLTVSDARVGAAANLTGGVLLPLLHEALAREGRMRWRLRGNSMTPTFPPDCEIEIVSLPAGGPRVGDVLVFIAGDTLIAHRLVRRAGDAWIMQGDGRRGPDPPLTPDQTLGKVDAAYQDGHRFWPAKGEAALAVWWVARYHALRLLRAGWRSARRLGRA